MNDKEYRLQPEEVFSLVREERYCKDCKHFDPSPSEDFCSRSVKYTPTTNLVRGDITGKLTGSWKVCREERYSSSFIQFAHLVFENERMCGKSGKFWEAKE